jgi:hypothetical protein
LEFVKLLEDDEQECIGRKGKTFVQICFDFISPIHNLEEEVSSILRNNK